MASAPSPFALIISSLLSTRWPIRPIDLEMGSAWWLLSLLGLPLGEASDAVCSGPMWARLWGRLRAARMPRAGCLGPHSERREKKKNLWRLQETTAQPLAVCTLNAFAVRTGAACIAPGPGLFELDLWPC